MSLVQAFDDFCKLIDLPSVLLYRADSMRSLLASVDQEREREQVRRPEGEVRGETHSSVFQEEDRKKGETAEADGAEEDNRPQVVDAQWSLRGLLDLRDFKRVHSEIPLFGLFDQALSTSKIQDGMPEGEVRGGPERTLMASRRVAEWVALYG